MHLWRLYGSGWGFRKLLNWVSKRYNSPDIYVTEAGWSLAAHDVMSGVGDPSRVAYYANYTTSMLKAIKEDNVSVKGFFAWSLMDNFEWERGYVERFGTTYNDFNVGLDPNAPDDSPQPTPGQQMRTRKQASCWFEAVWTDNTLVDPSGPGFRGCVNSTVFEKKYSDPSAPYCKREIRVNPDGVTGEIAGSDHLTGLVVCDGIEDI